MRLPEWWLYRLADWRTPIRFAGQKHEHQGWLVGLQHTAGGRFTEGAAATAPLAILAAALASAKEG